MKLFPNTFLSSLIATALLILYIHFGFTYPTEYIYPSFMPYLEKGTLAYLGVNFLIFSIWLIVIADTISRIIEQIVSLIVKKIKSQ